MVSITNSTAANQSGSTTYTTAPAFINGNNTIAAFLWCATARDHDTGGTPGNTNPPGNIFDLPARTATTCYMVGLKERLEIQTVDGLPWQWRRICFTVKSQFLPQNLSGGFVTYLENTSGYKRVWNQVPAGTQLDTLQSLIFRGRQGVDWIDPITAPLDSQRVTPKYDKTYQLRTGNADGQIRRATRWHPMRKNLVYDDDESGGTATGYPFSTTGKAGMGDYYVLDYFRPRASADATQQLSIISSSTLYWHER